MKLIANQGQQTVLSELQQATASGSSLAASFAVPALSLFGFDAAKNVLCSAENLRLILPADRADQRLFGSEGDRAFRNRLNGPALARRLAALLERADLRFSPQAIPQGVMTLTQGPVVTRAIAGQCSLSTAGLGVTPSPPMSLIQATDDPQESAQFHSWFEQMWRNVPERTTIKNDLLGYLRAIAEPNTPNRLYHAVLYHVFRDLGGELDEERIVKSATGIKTTTVWNKLFRFQRDGVIGVIDKLERLGGCIVADSVGLGKTFTALAVIKYYELRNDRVLVLAPKRLRDNWTLYKSNDRRNPLAGDRFHYDVLNHTDLSRERGHSGEIDLSHLNWGNYDLVVIDESHNFRNKAAVNTRVTRYSRLMEQIIRSGVKTRVLMLSATPVNNRLADLKNQIAFVTEGDDFALSAHGIPSVENTTRRAQLQFNAWQRLPSASAPDTSGN
ncbi:hypothetical protein DM785_16685 (plasmid) [Deinococcus actinosclerus]|nr:hypothetical protein DM785_16685 [Deinococcus actinosclerus]